MSSILLETLVCNVSAVATGQTHPSEVQQPMSFLKLSTS